LQEPTQQASQFGIKLGEDREKQGQQEEALQSVLNQWLKDRIYLSTGARSPRIIPPLVPKKKSTSNHRPAAARTPRTYVGHIRGDFLNLFCRQNKRR